MRYVGANAPSITNSINGGTISNATLDSSVTFPAGMVVNFTYVAQAGDVVLDYPSETTDTILSTSYTPITTGNWTLLMCAMANYVVAGDGVDSWFSRIKVGSTEVTFSRQIFVNASGGGSRSGSLFPLIGLYNGTGTSSRTLSVEIERSSADDDVTVYANAGSGLYILELTRS